jgi:DNA-directed RNA polymerase specialized sigma24 family protein
MPRLSRSDPAVSALRVGRAAVAGMRRAFPEAADEIDSAVLVAVAEALAARCRKPEALGTLVYRRSRWAAIKVIDQHLRHAHEPLPPGGPLSGAGPVGWELESEDAVRALAAGPGLLPAEGAAVLARYLHAAGADRDAAAAAEGVATTTLKHRLTRAYGKLRAAGGGRGC